MSEVSLRPDWLLEDVKAASERMRIKQVWEFEIGEIVGVGVRHEAQEVVIIGRCVTIRGSRLYVLEHRDPANGDEIFLIRSARKLWRLT
jgi:hypothetical protein